MKVVELRHVAVAVGRAEAVDGLVLGVDRVRACVDGARAKLSPSRGHGSVVLEVVVASLG